VKEKLSRRDKVIAVLILIFQIVNHIAIMIVESNPLETYTWRNIEYVVDFVSCGLVILQCTQRCCEVGKSVQNVCINIVKYTPWFTEYFSCWC